jgi:hypothetical protein
MNARLRIDQQQFWSKPPSKEGDFSCQKMPTLCAG